MFSFPSLYKFYAHSSSQKLFPRTLHFIGRHASRKQIEKLLTSGAVEIDFTKYVALGLLEPTCPIKRVYVNQLAANSPIEDRWNIGLTQVEGVVSSCLFTVLDGHSGSSCVHTTAWSILDYVAAALLDKQKLEAALCHWRTHDKEQPYHLARRLDLFSSNDHRLLGHAATPPPMQLSAHMRKCLRDYVEFLLNKPDRTVDPVHAMTDAFLRLDDDLCSTRFSIDLKSKHHGTEWALLSTLPRELVRVALSGAVGVVGRIVWKSNSNASAPELDVAYTGDCGAVLLRQVDPTDNTSDFPSFEAIRCTEPHQGLSNRAEYERVSAEHPDNRPTELFREGGRLLGELCPSRAFGNVRYKWPTERLLQLSRDLGSLSSQAAVSRSARVTPSDILPLAEPYTSPPYLTAKPDVRRFSLTPADRYVILATDGLWDMLSAEDTAEVMANEFHEPSSPATRLLWNCLTSVPPAMARAIAGDRDYKRGSVHKHKEVPLHDQQEEANRKAYDRAFKLLALPPGLARYYRDDITVMVIELFDRNGSKS